MEREGIIDKYVVLVNRSKVEKGFVVFCHIRLIQHTKEFLTKFESEVIKLKEVLEKSGMELALFDVNVRQNSQNGGNPTPGRQPSSGPGLSAVKGDTEKTGPAARPAATGKQTGNQDGLDVLV